MTTPLPPTRAWYCNDALVAEYKRRLADGENFAMSKWLRAVRVSIVNAGFITITLYAIAAGGDPTFVGGIGLFALAGYNGVELADWAAFAQALAEAGSGDEEE